MGSRAASSLFLASGLLALAPGPQAWAAETAKSPPAFKKIEIVETDNYFSPVASSLYPDDVASASTLSVLRAYVLERAALKPEDDPGVILKALEWVSVQWRHDGLHEARPGESALDILKDVHEKGARYRCVEFGFVVSELLKSLGYAARPVEIDSVDFAYGGFGRQHVAAEVWSNRLRKWIFIDPQNGAYPTWQGKFLSFYELYDLKKQGRFAEVKFNATDGFRERDREFDDKEFQTGYGEFLSKYFGAIGTAAVRNGKKYLLVLQLDGRTQPLTFQGWPYENAVFTQNAVDFYPEMNRTLLSFEYRDKIGSKEAWITAHGIKTEADYFAKMPLLVPKPDLVVSFADPSLWHSKYEFRTSRLGAWTQAPGDSMDWRLQEGENYLEARSVNKMDIPGPSTFVAVRYR